MEKISEMIERMCPEGVKRVSFEECATYTRGITYNKKQESTNEALSHKVLRANNITLGSNCLNFDDIKLVTKDVSVKSNQWLVANDILICAGSGSKEHVGKVAFIDKEINYTFGGFMAVIRSKANTLPRYLFHLLISSSFKEYLSVALNSTTINNLSLGVMAGFEIPLPPLPIQQEIVRILDSFTQLQSNLEAELAARQKQYEYYRNKLLTFEEGDDSVEWKTLGEIGTILRGNGLQKSDFSEEGVGCIHYGQIYTRLGFSCDKTLTYVPEQLAKSLTKVEPGNLVIACTSENVEDVCKSVVWLGNEDIVTGGHACVFKHNENPKYIGYCFITNDFFNQKKKYAYGAKVIDIKTEKLAQIIIPIPSLQRQQEIVTTLDTFESLIANLKQEIEARKKQYEYYREQLLTFE